MKRFLPLNTLVLLLILFSTILLYGEDAVRILRIIDGDTLKVNYKGKEESIRLIGIDAPESRPNKKAKNDAQRRDKYGRLLAYIYLPNGTMLNEEIVKAGYANLMTIPPNVKYQERFLKGYREARENRRGLWKDK